MLFAMAVFRSCINSFFDIAKYRGLRSASLGCCIVRRTTLAKGIKLLRNSGLSFRWVFTSCCMDLTRILELLTDVALSSTTPRLASEDHSPSEEIIILAEGKQLSVIDLKTADIAFYLMPFNPLSNVVLIFRGSYIAQRPPWRISPAPPV